MKRESLEEMFLQKLEDEWERFYLIKLCTSSANIFASAKEISRKQDIVFLIRQNVKTMDEKMLERLLYFSDLSEEIYRYASSYPEKPTAECVLKIMEKIATEGAAAGGSQTQQES